jgi:hypothetical protein
VLVGFKVGKICQNNMTRGELHSIITMYANRLNIYVKRGTDSMHGLVTIYYEYRIILMKSVTATQFI